jgi:hypothetical protein
MGLFGGRLQTEATSRPGKQSMNNQFSKNTSPIDESQDESFSWFSMDYPQYQELSAFDADILGDAVGLVNNPWE